MPVLASDEEVLRSKRFDALEPDELARLYRLMTRLRVATPERRTRRAERDGHGERIDLRRTLRGSLSTAGDPIRGLVLGHAGDRREPGGAGDTVRGEGGAIQTGRERAPAAAQHDNPHCAG